MKYRIPNGGVVQDGEVDLEYQNMETENEGFEAFVAAHYGSIEVATTPVTIFDQALKAAVERGGAGCGGSCCG